MAFDARITVIHDENTRGASVRLMWRNPCTISNLATSLPMLSGPTRSDDARWLAQKAELGEKTDRQSAQAFVAFVEEWCERAEEVLDVGYQTSSPVEAPP